MAHFFVRGAGWGIIANMVPEKGMCSQAGRHETDFFEREQIILVYLRFFHTKISIKKPKSRERLHLQNKRQMHPEKARTW